AVLLSGEDLHPSVQVAARLRALMAYLGLRAVGADRDTIRPAGFSVAWPLLEHESLRAIRRGHDLADGSADDHGHGQRESVVLAEEVESGATSSQGTAWR